MYFIPQDLLQKFEVVASNNCSADGRHIETLAYLFGHESGGNLIGTHLVFPEQDGTCSRVDDKGKFLDTIVAPIIDVFRWVVSKFFIPYSRHYNLLLTISHHPLRYQAEK